MGSNIYNNVFDTFSKPVPVPKMLVQYDIPLTKTIAFKFKIIPTEKKNSFKNKITLCTNWMKNIAFKLKIIPTEWILLHINTKLSQLNEKYCIHMKIVKFLQPMPYYS